MNEQPNKLLKAMAMVCKTCPVCRHARKTQQGTAYNFVNKVESSVCPFCRAYEKVYGRKPHVAISAEKR